MEAKKSWLFTKTHRPKDLLGSTRLWLENVVSLYKVAQAELTTGVKNFRSATDTHKEKVNK